MPYDFRLQCIEEPACRFAHALLACLSPAIPVSQLIKEIYDDDGRGNIRDYLLTKYTAGDYVLELIHDRKSDAVVNFRFYETDNEANLQCQQRPWPEGQTYRLIGENIPWYQLKADNSRAEDLLRFFVNIEQCGMNGYLTSEEKLLNDRRLFYIQNGNDPHLVIYRYRAVEYKEGFDKAMLYLNQEILKLTEFATYLTDLKKTLQSYKS